MEFVEHPLSNTHQRPSPLVLSGQESSVSGTSTPLARITTCGTLTIQVLQAVHTGANGQQEALYASPDPALLARKGSSTAFTLLSLLASQPGYFVTRDWLSEKLGHLPTEEEEEGDGLKRVDNVVSHLRYLLYPTQRNESLETRQVRRRLVEYRRASSESGPGYQLAGLPLLWLDVAEIEASIKRARKLEQFGADGLAEWQAAYDLAMGGRFLPAENYSDWAEWQRQTIEAHLWECVQVLWQRSAERGERGETEALRILRDYWQNHVTKEDALRPLLEFLGKREYFGEARACYDRLCAELASEDRQPDQRTRDIIEFQQAIQIQRKRGVVEGRRKAGSSLMPVFSDNEVSARDLLSGSQTQKYTPTPTGPLFPMASGPKETSPSAWNMQQPLSPAETLERLSRALAKPVQLDDRALLALETVVRDCWRFRPDILGMVTPPLLQVVLGHLQQITMFLSGSLLVSTRMRLCALASELTQIAGWTLYEMRAFSQAQAYYQMAILAAREAEHSVLEAIALARMSRIFKYCAQEESVLPSLQYARQLLGNQQKSPVYSWLCAEEALAYAREGCPYESLKTLERVTEIFQPENQEDDPYWVGFEANVKAGFFGSCYVALKQPEQAEIWYREALAQIHITSRINPNHRRSLLSTNLAAIVLEQEAIEEACQLAREAIHMLSQSKSPLVLQHLVKFRRKLEPWKSQTAVETFETAFLQIRASFLTSEATIL